MSSTRFAANVAVYFRDFLETNFHKRKAPKRSIKTRNEKNFLVGINLRTFNDLRSQIFKNVSQNLVNPITIEKGRHKHGLSDTNWQIINRYCETIKDSDLQSVESELEIFASESLKAHPEDLEQAKDVIAERITIAISRTFFEPLNTLIGPSLKAAHSFDEEMIASIFEELRSLFGEAATTLASDFVIANVVEQISAPLRISGLIGTRTIKDNIKTYFETITSEDLYYELNELASNLTDFVDRSHPIS
ncbi:MAG: hypothetical protein IPJ84_10265 [Bdellovibrionales bacterium]|nr:hypothetical protein [Bdellovibrionales bacterium]